MSSLSELGAQAPLETHGLTGIYGRDGVLTFEQQKSLDALQQEAANACLRRLAERGEGDYFPMVAMATGIGKGKIIHEVIRRQFQDKLDSKILVVAGTKLVLVEQTAEALNRYQDNGVDEVDQTTIDPEDFLGYSIGKYCDETVDIQVATIQTIQRRHKAGRLNHDDYDLVIVDEVHNIGTPQRVSAIKGFKRAVGFTATPYRYSGPLKYPHHYGFEVTCSFTLPEAQEQSYLPPLYALQINTADIIESVPTTLSGKIDYPKLEKVLKEHTELLPYIAKRIIPLITHGGKNYKTGIAVNFIWEAIALAEELRRYDIKAGLSINEVAARVIHSEEVPAVDTERRFKLPHNHPDSLQVLISPYKVGEGFDAPGMEFFVWASPTDSPLRYTQYTGRLARRTSGKAYGVVVDCLYQTSQYGWTYNFGMWMKRNVRQLESGVLYLGPMHAITDVAEIVSLRASADNFSLVDLEKESETIFHLQEGEMAANFSNLKNIFVGEQKNIECILRVVLDELKRESPQLVVRRINVRRPVEAVTDPDVLIQMMIEHGAKLKDPNRLLDVQPTDILLTHMTLTSIFKGSWEKIRDAKDSIRKRIGSEDSPLYRQIFLFRRKVGANTVVVDVCTDREKFISWMEGAGMELKGVDTESLKEGEYKLTDQNLAKDFFRPDKGFRGLVGKAKLAAQEEDPSVITLFCKRRVGTLTVKVCTDRERFIQWMIQAGGRRKNLLNELQPEDIVLSSKSLSRFGFRGPLEEVKAQVVRVKSYIKLNFPDEYSQLFTLRRNPPKVSTVCTDKGRFVRWMIEQGASFFPQKCFEETDLKLTQSVLRTMFKGDWGKIKEAVTRVKAKVQAKSSSFYPSLFEMRGDGNKIIEVCRDRGLFVGLMAEEGIKLK
ncbi:MAG: DEAD/DEAH box helicase family protein [Candidatus Blackburnbacteria bacterium]|nr:DEAD/DEAH box helicase family protein [Candidatus Blackburnbacteria bacterium]